ncbi:hypothetical protein [Methylorubrum zatmanii]|nr:hypothetical protein [Methylorubrum zatmanii]
MKLRADADKMTISAPRSANDPMSVFRIENAAFDMVAAFAALHLCL